uniref:Abi family protein n=1 Tax=Pasteurella multocida TaxID=747 RepID=UPI00403DD140
MLLTKPHKEYAELVDILLTRKMVVEDISYAKRKLSQVGYYRLSGFWFTSRRTAIVTENGIRQSQFIDEFLPNTSFNEVYKLYLFDKKLRLLLLDIIERLEVNIRSVMAHELGRIDPLAYKNKDFIKKDSPKVRRNYGNVWLPKLQDEIKRNKAEFIIYHRENDKEIPFWVIVEIWDFGTLSKYYSFLKGNNQKKISKKFGIDHVTFEKWLHEINILRNLCAHHSRVWNKDFNAITLPNTRVETNERTSQRVFSRILILWYLIQQTDSKNYKWLEKLKDLIDTDFPDVPNAKLEFMGLGEYTTLPIELMKQNYNEST